MGLKENYSGKTIFIDTAPLIYYIEGHSVYNEKLRAFIESVDDGDVILQTSVLTLLEVLVQPIRLKRLKLAHKYETILTSSPNIEIYDIDLETSRRAAELRANYNLKTPDALQIAMGIEKNANSFLTNDYELNRVREIHILTLEEL